MQMNHAWLEVGSPKWPYSPGFRGPLGTSKQPFHLFPWGDREAPALGGCSGTKGRECPSSEDTFAGICLAHNDPLLPKLLSHQRQTWT